MSADEVTSFEQTIYNTWLRTVRVRAKKPFRPRKTWDLPPETRVYLHRLAAFFAKHRNIDIECFFNAPYEVYVHDINSAYTLSFFTTHKAISLYTAYLKTLRLLPPDHPSSVEWIRRSFLYIGRICSKGGLTLSEYVKSAPDVIVPPFLRDVKDGFVSLFATFAFPNVINELQSLSPDIRQLMLGDIDFHQLYREYLASKHAKPLAEKSFSALEKYLFRRVVTRNS